ncbi:unnamed protein product [Brassica oleracea var. botrytis]
MFTLFFFFRLYLSQELSTRSALRSEPKTDYWVTIFFLNLITNLN